jgi:tRNA pseudouridine55 synthase
MTTADSRGLCGVLLVDKPEGLTSAQVVAVAKRALDGIKVGHLGTLDPFASGLLPLCVGEGTKLARYINQADKRYSGVIRLGLTTDTLDRTGQAVAEAPVPNFADADLDRITGTMVGEIEQVPPMFSAIKKDGVPMYRRARDGVIEELEPRIVMLYELRLHRIDPDHLGIDVHCSKGTYVRALARDIAAALSTVGLLESLVRIEFGGFSLSQAVNLATVRERGRGVLGLPAWVSGADVLANLRAILADPAAVRALRAGQQRILATFPPPAEPGSMARVLDTDRHLVAVLCEKSGLWRIDRVFS